MPSSAWKNKNVSKDNVHYLLDVVAAIQSKGLLVTAGFILGLDSDPVNIFAAMKEFIHKSGIPVAMVGLLNAVRGTDLHKRLEAAGRLLSKTSGNNLDAILNFVPEIDKAVLLDGYKAVLSAVYDPGLRGIILSAVF